METIPEPIRGKLVALDKLLNNENMDRWKEVGLLGPELSELMNIRFPISVYIL
jgi:hypothetical protein